MDYSQDAKIRHLRSLFPALGRLFGDKPLVYLDGPAGTQVPTSVAERICQCMIEHNANRAGKFITSIEVDQLMDDAHGAVADFLQVDNPKSIAFGPNMTSLTLSFSRALARTWRPGDEILVSNLDHDANYTPWVLAAKDAGAIVRTIAIRPEDATLDMESLESQLNSRTKLGAVTAASNAVGSLTDIPSIARMVHRVGAELFVDAVHYAPHRRIDIAKWDCDYLACSAYKFFGPHIGILYGKPERMQALEPYKLRPSPNTIPGRWMTGTQNHACIAGVTAAIDYIASIADEQAENTTGSSRRSRLDRAFAWIDEVETHLVQRLLEGLLDIQKVKVYGITDSQRSKHRAPTVAFCIEGIDSSQAATQLAEAGICAWHGNYYALPLTLALGTEPQGMVRLGCMHYNTIEEIDRTLHQIVRIAR
ncbi:MAG: cysteine desulfurase-like protein [Planctomycetota bacterium]